MATTKRKPIKKTLYTSLKYITNSEKTNEEFLISGINGSSEDPKIAFRQMRFTKLEFNKKDKIQAHHFMQSFKPGEVSAKIAHEIGVKWANELFGENFQGILSTHVDKEHIHNHIIINSVSHINGKKYYSNDKEYKFIKEKSDNLCREYGLSIIKKETEKNKESKRKTQKECQDFWKNAKLKKQEMVKEDIDTTILNSKNFDDFIAKMKRQGYDVKYGNVKHISFKKIAEQAVRGTKIGEEYSEENIRKRIKERAIGEVESKKDEGIKFEKIGIVTINKALILKSLDNIYTTKIPGRNLYIKYDDAKRINNDTISVNINLNKTYTVYNSQRQETQMTGEELFKCYDDKTKEILFSYGTNKTNKTNSYINKSYQYNPYKLFPYRKKYYCKNKNIFFRSRRYFRPNIFKYKNSYGTFRWNYTKPSSRNSLLVLLILLKTKKVFEQKMMFDFKNSNITNKISPEKIRVLTNNIKNIEESLRLMSKYKLESLDDVNKAIVDLETTKKENFKHIKVLEEKQIEKKLINDLIDKYIEYKPAYIQFKQKNIKTKMSIEFVKIYNVLSSCGLENEMKILEFRASFDDFLEDIQNEIIDIKDNNTLLNKEKYNLERIKESIIDMKQDNYEIINKKGINIENQNKKYIEKKQAEMEI